MLAKRLQDLSSDMMGESVRKESEETSCPCSSCRSIVSFPLVVALIAIAVVVFVIVFTTKGAEKAKEVRLSVGRTGCCRDNAVAESFFASLKNEIYHRKTWRTREAARMAVLRYIECFYNRRRPHAAINYAIPAQVMRGFFDRTAPKADAHREEERAAKET